MKEKDIENLLARYPEEFFPNAGFKLLGQQVNIGRRFVDIMFVDKYDRTIIIEVKRGLLTRDGSGQIIEYYGLLKQQYPDKIIELILCANVIPSERKLFLENVGIECKELGLALLLNIAKKHEYTFLDEDKPHKPVDIPISKPVFHPIPSTDNEQNVWLFQANPNRYDILNALADPELDEQCWQINQFKDSIKKDDIALIWMSGRDSGIYAVTQVSSGPQLMADFPKEEKYWVKDEDKGVKRLKVVINIKNRMLNKPLFRSELKDIKGLKNLSIFRQAQGTNFLVRKEEWEIIRNKINERL